MPTRRDGDVRSIFPMVASWSPSRMPGTYITKLPKTEHEAAEWQAAMEALILVATRGGPTMLARIGVMRALSCHVERVFELSVKKSIFGDVASACLPVLCDFVEAGPESPVHASVGTGDGAEPRQGIRCELRRQSSHRRHIPRWMRCGSQGRIRRRHWPR